MKKDLSVTEGSFLLDLVPERATQQVEYEMKQAANLYRVTITKFV